jgi:selenocysteine-specific elongation factor
MTLALPLVSIGPSMPVAVERRVIATAGHVDHGKSALVRVLTGTDPDRLPDEKRRGMTIDLGFAHLLLADEARTFDVGIVDVPGHEDFLRNMIAGVGSVDLALLVVAADDGPMPQTLEHLEILTALGVTRAVVALTKSDLVADPGSRVAQLRDHLAAGAFAGASIVPVSVVSGRGLTDLRQALLDALAESPPPPDVGKPRLHVDRAFARKGAGVVVTGTLSGGRLTRGQEVALEPHGGIARIRSIQSHNRDFDTAHPGSRVALALVDVQLPGSHTLGRGTVITVAGLPARTTCLDVLLHLRGDPPRHHARVVVHHGTTAIPARLLCDSAAPALAQLRLDGPLYAFAGDRLLLRDAAALRTLGGATVLRVQAQRRGSRTSSWREPLLRVAADPADVEAWVLLGVGDVPVVPVASVCAAARWGSQAMGEAVRRLEAAGRLRRIAGELLTLESHWKHLRQRLLETVDSYHAAHPERVGMPVSEFRSALRGEPAPVVSALLDDLFERDLVQSGPVVARPTHRPALPRHLRAAGEVLLELLDRYQLQPPCRNQLAPDPPRKVALQFLLDAGYAVSLNTETLLSARWFRHATGLITEYLRARGSATVTDLKTALGTTRRVMVPLLERLDQQGITRRSGDLRVLAESPSRPSIPARADDEQGA